MVSETAQGGKSTHIRKINHSVSPGWIKHTFQKDKSFCQPSTEFHFTQKIFQIPRRGAEFLYNYIKFRQKIRADNTAEAASIARSPEISYLNFQFYKLHK